MLFVVLVVLLGSMINVLGCGETKTYVKTDTVEKAWDEIIIAYKEKDVNRLYNMISESSKDEGRDMGLSEAEIKETFEKGLEEISNVDFDWDAVQVTNIREEGDVAYVEFTVEGYPDWPTTEYKFVKENGEWKFEQ